jgi:2-polyprenyl-6-methoxyphenol hydroxylase-like FAD-dependent oxidoreductase
MSKQAVIIGAGIAGLATALRLRQAGWTPLVVERAPARRTGGYTVTFSDLGYDAAQRLGILDELAERHITPDALHYLKPSGVRRFSVPGPTVRAMLGRRALNLMRGDIEDVLYRAVAADVEIRFGTTATAVRAEPAAVTVELDDGSTVRADLLVGADGLHSATRAATFGPERDFRLDLDHMVGVFTLDRLPSGVTPGATETLTEAGRTLAVIATGDRRPTAFFGYRCADPAAELAAGPTAALPAAYERMGWVAPQVLEQLAGADEVYFDSISQIVLPSWHRGRVAILGDAAWCVTLFAGFGASLAVAGADALGTALERHGDDVDAALAEWEAGLRPYAERKQQLGRQVRGLYAPADRTRLFLRDLPLRLAALPPVGRLLQRRLQLTR